MNETAAILYAVICAIVVLFQLALIAGAPWGVLTQGGRHSGPLPARGRVFAGLSIVVLAALSAAALSAAELSPGWPGWTYWPAIAIQALSTLANFATPSAAERRLWAPVTSGLLLLLLVVGLA